MNNVLTFDVKYMTSNTCLKALFYKFVIYYEFLVKWIGGVNWSGDYKGIDLIRFCEQKKIITFLCEHQKAVAALKWVQWVPQNPLNIGEGFWKA